MSGDFDLADNEPTLYLLPESDLIEREGFEPIIEGDFYAICKAFLLPICCYCI
jgi:hypothetical protein